MQKQLIQLQRDTEREDTLKSMVDAWDADQPGRSKKVRRRKRKREREREGGDRKGLLLLCRLRN